MRWVVTACYALAAVPAALVLAEALLVLCGAPAVADLVETLVGSICHHLESRTIGTPPWPVCARCSGAYLGWALALPVAFLTPSIRDALGRLLLGALAGSFGVGVLAFVVELVGIVQTSNPERLLLGVPLGLAPAFAILKATRTLSRDARREPPALA